MHNLAAVAGYGEKLADMQAELVATGKALGDFEFFQGELYWQRKAELEV